MPDKQNDPQHPNTYQIRIKEHLETRWQDWFDGMEITQDSNGETLLIGEIIDQAHLFGLLKKIRNLGLTLISVTRINPENDQ